MKINKVKIRNFKSIAGKWVEFDIKDGLTLVTGENGKGKTTLINAIVFGLFNKNSDLKGSSKTSIPLKELINEANGKELEVHILLDNGIEIQRGLKPDYFHILKNGKNLADKSSKTIDQKYLENEILGGLTFDIFNKVNFISAKAISTPFLYMSLSDRKSFIENILDIRILYYIQQVLKQKISLSKLELKSIESELSMLKNFVESESENITKQKIRRMEQLQKLQEMKENKTQMIQKFQSEIDELGMEIYDLKLEIEGHIDRLTMLESKCKDLQELVSDRDVKERRIGEIIEKIQSIKNDVLVKDNERKVFEKNLEGFELCGDCPTVAKIVGHFDYSAFNQFVGNMKNKVKELMSEKQTLDEELIRYDSIQKEIDALVDQIRELETKIDTKSKTIGINESDIERQQKLKESLINQLNDMVVPEVDETNLIKYRNDLSKKESEYDIEKQKLEKYEYLKTILGNKNIKQELFEYYIPLFEKRVNDVLEVLMEDDSFSFKIKIDKDFNIFGYRNGKKSNIFKLSEGQKASINFAFMFAVLYVLQLKNGFQLEFLFIDEVLDGALSSSRKEKVLELLHIMSRDIPIMLVSHDQSLNKEYFDHEIKVSMKNKISIYQFN